MKKAIDDLDLSEIISEWSKLIAGLSFVSKNNLHSDFTINLQGESIPCNAKITLHIAFEDNEADDCVKCANFNLENYTYKLEQIRQQLMNNAMVPKHLN